MYIKYYVNIINNKSLDFVFFNILISIVTISY